VKTFEVIFKIGDGETATIETRNVKADRVWYGRGIVALLAYSVDGTECRGLYPLDRLMGLTQLDEG
jgi:hypothetical protein